MPLRAARSATLFRHGLVLMGALVAGALVGQPWAALALAALALLRRRRRG